MATRPQDLLEKLKTLPPRRLAEVEDFVDFLAHRESRSTALDRLLAIAPALEAAGEPQMTEEEIAAEIKAVRAERRARQTRNDDNASGRT